MRNMRNARGLTNKEIADELCVGETTVRTHVRHILAKLGLRNRVYVVVLVNETYLAQPGTS
jgi:DNA-binding NarL/FixJ family response regulator